MPLYFFFAQSSQAQSGKQEDHMTVATGYAIV